MPVVKAGRKLGSHIADGLSSLPTASADIERVCNEIRVKRVSESTSSLS